MSIVEFVRKTSLRLEEASTLMLAVADQASEAIDKINEALQDALEAYDNEQAAEQPTGTERAGSEGPSHQYMYNYLKVKLPEVYDTPRIEEYLMEDVDTLERLYRRHRDIFDNLR